MIKKVSRFDGESYKGYRVSLRLVRENLAEYEPVSVCSPREVYEFMSGLSRSDRERIYSLHLDSKNVLMGCEEISCGTLSSSLVHPREVFKSAILSSCASIIVVHNHPSGDPQPSGDDEAVTRRLYDAGNLLGIDLLDSIILGDDCYYSFKESGGLERHAGR